MTTSLFPNLQDQKLYRDAKKIREWLSDLSGLTPLLNEDPNHFNTTISGLTLIEYHGGPSAVGTPFGSWAFTGGGGIKNPDWRKEATDRLGLEICNEEETTDDIVYGPVWKITKNLDGEELPTVDVPNINDVIYGQNYLSELQLSTKTLLAEIGPRLDIMRAERTARFFDGGRENYILNGYKNKNKLEYDLYKVLWHEMKKAIGFVAWNDRVDPNYYPYSCYTQSELDKHLKSMGFAPATLRIEKGNKIFAVVGANKTEFIIVCKYPYIIQRVICRDHQEATPKIADIAAKILKREDSNGKHNF